MPFQKYRAFTPVDLPDRTWPSRTITQAPRWCSVDLRDGNQALIDPMRPDEKLRFWKLLIEMGFEEIEAGFPAASQTDFDFFRKLIDEDLIPDRVYVQALCQMRKELIERTVDAFQAHPARHLPHLQLDLDAAAPRGVQHEPRGDQGPRGAGRGVGAEGDRAHPGHGGGARVLAGELHGDGARIRRRGLLRRRPALGRRARPRKMIINLPATVEMSTPNIYADQIEWFCRNLPEREHCVISLHTHNDRGTGVAATELGILAGADRVEGTLFGNGERTGNADLIALAMNCFSQGVDPQLDMSDMRHIRSVAESCNKLAVPERHPYAGDLVFTAFSGSHQDAIRKGMTRVDVNRWEVPYLPIDPADVGGHYRETVRVNSQSGKGGVAFVLENHFELSLPRPLLMEFARVVQEVADRDGGELTASELRSVFDRTYLNVEGPYRLARYDLGTVRSQDGGEDQVECTAELVVSGNPLTATGQGNGPIDAFVKAVERATNEPFEIEHYHEQSEESGSGARALCQVGLKDADGGICWGAGTSHNTVTASFQAVLAALNRRSTQD
jgi:2-isopropylmalate synthase